MGIFVYFTHPGMRLFVARQPESPTTAEYKHKNPEHTTVQIHQVKNKL